MSTMDGFRFSMTSRLSAPAEEVFAWHGRPGALSRLIPPWERVEVLEHPAGLEQGGRVVLLVRAGPLRRRWVARLGDVQPGRGFTDRQESGPFKSWVHTHGFEPDTEETSLLTDTIDYRLPLGPLGGLARPYVERKLRRMFAYRHTITAADLERHNDVTSLGPQRVAISGAGGLVGSRLARFLSGGGHHVLRLARREGPTGDDELRWNPATGSIDGAALEGVDAVVHLAGENIAAGRWTVAQKQRIRDSRVNGTRLLAEALARLTSPPRVFVCASAIGFYGDRGDEVLDENSPPGEGFLPDVCREWEAASEPAEHAGIRTVRLRIGVVMSGAGGALKRMLPPFRLGLGGRLGSGRQRVSWIALEDLLGIIHYTLGMDSLTGAVNATAPNPVTNAELTRTLARVLRRPAVFPAPAPVLRLALGEMADALLLEGADVRPRRLQENGFPFRFPDLESALRFELGR